VREPLVDPASGRVEEIPETELPSPDLVAPALTGAALDASRRQDARLARIGERTVVIDGRERKYTALNRLTEADLTGWFEDNRLMAGETRDAAIAASLVTASTDALAAGSTAGAPSAAQASALRDIDARALGGIRMDWDPTRGTPRRLAGPLYAERGVATWPQSQRTISLRSGLR